MYNERVWSISSIGCRGTSRHKSSQTSRFIDIQVEAAVGTRVEDRRTSRGSRSWGTSRFIITTRVEASMYESRHQSAQELKHKSVHYRHKCRGTRHTRHKVQQHTSRGTRHTSRGTSRGTRHTSRGKRHTSRGKRHTSRGKRHTSRGKRHTSRGTRHTSRGTRHTSRSTRRVEAPSIQVEASIQVDGRVEAASTIHQRGTNQIRTKYTSRGTRHTSRGTKYISVRVEALGIVRNQSKL